MKSTAWLPILVLVAVILATGLSWWFSLPDREYLFDGERGIARPEVAEWWRVQAPLVVGFGLIAGVALIASLRTARTRAWGELVASLAVAVLGVGTLSGSIYCLRYKSPEEPVECTRPTPESPPEVFLQSQWFVLSVTPPPGTSFQIENRMGPLRETGLGLKEHPGYIPFDPFLLERVSFIGLTSEEVEDLLGPPAPSDSPDLLVMSYHMVGFYHSFERATLYLSFGKQWERSDTVLGEHLRHHLSRY